MPAYYPNHNYGPEHAAAIGATPKKQISEKQLAANRANARKSSGPASDEGKSRCSLNALRYGLTGQTSALTDEDRAAQAAFTAPIVDALKPQGALERQIALSIAEGHWRLNRVRAMEDNIFALGHFGPAAEIDVDHAELHSALTSARVFLDRSKDFERLTLYEQRIQRGIEKHMRELETLQAARKAAREEALEEAAQLLQVDDLYEEETANGSEFSTEEIRSRIDRNDRLKRAAYHEKNYWDPKIEYPAAA